MRALFVTLLLLGAACQRGGDAPAPVAPAPEARAAAPAAEVDLKVEAKPDGTLAFSAKDKWGQSLDTTYENVTYLENALPTLERALSPEQTAKLKAEVERLKAPK